tara:strand:+ start:185 stop:394 length:210 start_codon:yes stop_codon:yes gene_type:complete
MRKKSSKQKFNIFSFCKEIYLLLLPLFLDFAFAIFIFKMNKKLLLIIIIIVAIEFSGYGILSTLYKLFG